MRDTCDLKNAFGEADEGFKGNVTLTLNTLEKGNVTMKKSKLKVIIAVAAVFTLLTTAAFAATNSEEILSFINERWPDVNISIDDASLDSLGTLKDKGVDVDGMLDYMFENVDENADLVTITVVDDGVESDDRVSVGRMGPDGEIEVKDFTPKNADGEVEVTTEP